jgi:hypothetical protein
MFLCVLSLSKTAKHLQVTELVPVIPSLASKNVSARFEPMTKDSGSSIAEIIRGKGSFTGGMHSLQEAAPSRNSVSY